LRGYFGQYIDKKITTTILEPIMQFLANTTSPFVRIAEIAMIEKGLNIERTIVDPWADDPRLRSANAATRVPTLVLDDGTPLNESLLIVNWLEASRGAPQWPCLLGSLAETAGILSRAGIALGAIEASVHTIITRKVTAPALFDETPVGLRRRRTMVEALQRLEEATPEMTPLDPASMPLMLDAICAITLYDYMQFRFGDQTWLPATPQLKTLAATMQVRPSVRNTLPR
jgi:glutathione S-transferase